VLKNSLLKAALNPDTRKRRSNSRRGEITYNYVTISFLTCMVYEILLLLLLLLSGARGGVVG
jgi:hypothetical protein